MNLPNINKLVEMLMGSSSVWYQERCTGTGCVTSEEKWRVQEQKIVGNGLGVGRRMNIYETCWLGSSEVRPLSCATGFLPSLEKSLFLLCFSSLFVKNGNNLTPLIP